MNTPNIETDATAQAVAPAEEPRARKKATSGARKPRVAASKPKSGKKATPAKKAPKGAKAAKTAEKEAGAREGTKAAKVLDLLTRSNGATIADLMKATNWQAHSVRGYLSGTVGKKLGLKVESTKVENGERSYSVKA
jgi:DNA replication initiation complex subunit (GINS family)